MRNRIRDNKPNEDEITEEDVALALGKQPPPKQVIMYHANDEDPNRLYTLARLEDETIDRIADRVIAKLDERKGKRK